MPRSTRNSCATTARRCLPEPVRAPGSLRWGGLRRKRSPRWPITALVSHAPQYGSPMAILDRRTDEVAHRRENYRDALRVPDRHAAHLEWGSVFRVTGQCRSCGGRVVRDHDLNFARRECRRCDRLPCEIQARLVDGCGVAAVVPDAKRLRSPSLNRSSGSGAGRRDWGPTCGGWPLHAYRQHSCMTTGGNDGHLWLPQPRSPFTPSDRRPRARPSVGRGRSRCGLRSTSISASVRLPPSHSARLRASTGYRVSEGA